MVSPVRRYAEGTTVSVDNSQNEMRGLLRKHGATEFGLYEGAERQAVQFTLGGRQYRFDVERPTRDWADLQTSLLPHYSRYEEVIERTIAGEWKRRWRARLLWLKATLEFAAGEGDDELPYVLAAFTVLETGQTLGMALRTGAIPLLTPGGR